MNRVWTLLGLVVTLNGTAAIAQQSADEHASHHPDQQAQQGKTEPQTPEPLSGLVQGMKKIQALMARIHATADPAERDALMNEHLRAMREETEGLLASSKGMGMGMMSKDRGAGAGEGDGKMGMMSDDKMAPKDEAAEKQPQSAGAAGQKSGMMGGEMGKGMMRMHKAMETRINILTMLLQQMLEREAVEAGVEHAH